MHDFSIAFISLSLLSPVLLESICIFDDVNLCSNCTALQIENYTNSCIDDGSILWFCSKNIHLSKVMFIREKSDITLIGMVDDAVNVVCSTSDKAGLHLDRIMNLKIEKLNFKDCSFEYAGISGAIFITASAAMIIADVKVCNACGTGLIILNTFDTIEVLRTSFEYNSANCSSEVIGGGGMYIEIYINSWPSQYSNYILTNCTFQYNNITSKPNRSAIIERSDAPFSKFGGGGGLSITLLNNVSNNTFRISNCNFLSNSAGNGGGMYIGFRDASFENKVTVLHTNFTQNQCWKNGGGGLEVGFVPPHSHISETHDYFPHQNSAMLIDCHFVDNMAAYGGGVSIYASQHNSYKELKNSIDFMDSSWSMNSATVGAAVDLSSHIWNRANGILPKTNFTNCTFKSNHIKDEVDYKEIGYSSHSKGEGTFFSVGFTIYFCGDTQFISNNGSSLYLASSIAVFSQYSNTTFANNSGFSGGAISMIGFSAVNLEDNTTIDFISNCAQDKGGAINVINLNKKDVFSTYSCFFQYVGKHKDVNSRQIQITFSGNRAGGCKGGEDSDHHSGHSIFASTLRSCYYRCQRLENTKSSQIDNNTFHCIGNFIFNYFQTAEIATSGNNIYFKDNVDLPLKVIPGKYIELPIRMEDDLQQEVKDVFHISVTNSNISKISIHPSDGYNHGKWIRFYGMPGDKADVVVETVNNREIGVSFMVEMLDCPPGYVLDKNGKDKHELYACICSASTDNRRTHGIHRCNDSEYTAILSRGYFLGYTEEHNDTFGKEEYLISSYCPPGYCSTNRPSKTSRREYPLLNTTSIVELDKLICGPNRTGLVCGSCVENHSTYYHSTKYHCDTNTHCHLGWLYYILTEVMPVTVFFMVIIVFDIKLTTGAFNGFVFYAQIIDTLMISANGFIVFPDATYQLLRIGRLITRMFSLNFFSLKELSYCLWRSATTLDIIIFKYVTILYALLLVFVIVMFLKFCSCSRLFNKLGMRNYTAQTTVLHGLTGFLVICYSECVRISLLILTPITLFKASSNGSLPMVVFYNGELEYLAGKHLYYAIPAGILFIVFGIIPPILLVSYPLCYKFFALLHINETKVASFLCKIFPLEMARPLFDAFQSSFKDNYRYFSGLYFVYRLTILSSFVLLHNLTEFYLNVQVQLTLILAIHAVIQPYKKVWHNIVDGVIFMILASINAMTVFNYKHATELLDYQGKIRTVSALQILLIYIPLVYMTIYVSIKTWEKLKYLFKINKEKVKGIFSIKAVSVSMVSVIRPVDRADDELLNDEYHYRKLDGDYSCE